MRASDDLRERTVSRLGAGYADGLLGFDTLCRRVDRAYTARSVEQLRALVRDLPSAAGLLERVRSWVEGLVRSGEPDATALLSPPEPGPGRVLVVGRGSDCDLDVADGTVSRRHAGLARRDGAWTIEDLGSRNGTFVNGWRVRESGPLEPGDAVRLGQVQWVFAPRGS